MLLFWFDMLKSENHSIFGKRTSIDVLFPKLAVVAVHDNAIFYQKFSIPIFCWPNVWLLCTKLFSDYLIPLLLQWLWLRIVLCNLHVFSCLKLWITIGKSTKISCKYNKCKRRPNYSVYVHMHYEGGEGNLQFICKQLVKNFHRFKLTKPLT